MAGAGDLTSASHELIILCLLATRFLSRLPKLFLPGKGILWSLGGEDKKKKGVCRQDKLGDMQGQIKFQTVRSRGSILRISGGAYLGNCVVRVWWRRKKSL